MKEIPHTLPLSFSLLRMSFAFNVIANWRTIGCESAANSRLASDRSAGIVWIVPIPANRSAVVCFVCFASNDNPPVIKS